MTLDDLKLKCLTDQLHIDLSNLQGDRLTFQLRQVHCCFQYLGWVAERVELTFIFLVDPHRNLLWLRCFD